MDWGGARAGAGRKPKGRGVKALHGSQYREPVRRPTELLPAPPVLTAAERAVWDELAPHACAARTLTAATAYGFQVLCRNIVLERALAAKDPGSAAHRGVIQRIDSELLRFALAPVGKPMDVELEPPKDDFDEFDGGRVQ